VRLRTSARAEAMAALSRARAGSAEVTVATAASDVVLISNLSPERTVAILTAAGVPFSEVSAHRATLEDAYLQLTKDAVEFRADQPAPAPSAEGAAR
jgi:ABC-2 type transport system ATP-binding protein